MTEITLSQNQIHAIAVIAEVANGKDWLKLISPPKGELLDRAYVEIQVYGVEGNLKSRTILTYVGSAQEKGDSSGVGGS